MTLLKTAVAAFSQKALFYSSNGLNIAKTCKAALKCKEVNLDIRKRMKAAGSRGQYWIIEEAIVWGDSRKALQLLETFVKTCQLS